MKLFVAVILTIVFFGAINCEVDFEELEDGLEPSLKELRASVDAAWELEKRKEEGDLEKRADDDREELMAMVDAALERLSARKQEEEEAEMNQQAEMMRNAMEKRDGDDEVAELETAPGDFISLSGSQTSQSSTSHNGASARGVDGNDNTDYGKKFCTHTKWSSKAGENWWQVDLGGIYDVTSVYIVNRGDCCADRLADFKIKLSDNADGSGAVQCAAQVAAMTAGQKKTFQCVSPTTGRYLRISKPATTALTLCEVKVTGTRAPQKGIFLDGCNTLVPNKMLIGTQLRLKKLNKSIQIKGKCEIACVESDDCVGFQVTEHYIKTKEACLVFSKLTGARDLNFGTSTAFEKCSEEDD